MKELKRKKIMKHWLSCDWGTSAFRLRLVERDSCRVVSEEKSGYGISTAFRDWQASVMPREAFFAGIIRRGIVMLGERTGLRLEGLPVVLSGMASASIGMVELPYHELPFSLNGRDLHVQAFEEFLIISGARFSDDVMRGEETKIAGCAAWLKDDAEEKRLLLPGTHPKHVVVQGGKAIAFKTFMTGELFDLLSKHSILSASVNTGGILEAPGAGEAFRSGLIAGKSGDLLHEVFMVRTNQLLKNVPPELNSFYLSGLLIGSELSSLPSHQPVYLVAGALHGQLYATACEALGIPVSAIIDADEALIRGQAAVLNH